MKQRTGLSKKLLSLLLTVLMVVTALPLTAITSFAATSGDWQYFVLGDGTAEISGYNGNATKLVIPSKIDGKAVTSIGREAFAGYTSLKSVTIGNSVKCISDFSFYCCTSLSSITITDSVTSIGDSAFANTAYYNNDANWVNDVLYIGNHCIDAKFTLSGKYAIKANTKTIAERAFAGCQSLTSITIPNSVTGIGVGAFYNTAYYNNAYNWENNVLYISNHLIEARASLIGEYAIKANTKTIADYAFKACNLLTKITIPDSVTSIGCGVFYGCSSLTSITIPDGITNIGELAFYDCTFLTSISIPNSVTSIGDEAFSYCTSLTSITIPNSVTGIGVGAFSDCTSLTRITIPDSVTSIGDRAFEDCTSLTSVKIPASVTSIGNFAFFGCTSLTSVTIPDSVTSIGWSVFDNTAYYNNADNWKNDVLYIGNHLIEARDTLSGKYAIKEGTKTIALSAFNCCSSLTSITIPKSVTSIGSYAFSGCTSLKSIKYGGTFSKWVKMTTGKTDVCEKGTTVYCQGAPTTKVANAAGGVKISWSKMAGAKGYYVYRKTGSGSYSKIATVTTLSYLDKTAKAGTTYTYAVRAYNGNVVSAFNAVNIIRLANTTVKLANTTAGVKVSWTKVAGAKGYYVYRKTGSGSYSKIATTTSLSYVDKTAKSGTTYTYAVSAYNGSSLSAKTGVKLLRLATPTVKLANTKNGPKATWGKVAGAKGYYVYRKTGSGSYSKIATTTALSYVDKTAKAGTKYTYAVRAYNGKVVSAFNAVSIVRLATPTVKLANTKNGPKATWGKIAGAKGYYIYRKTGSGSYSKIATIKSGTTVSYVDKTAKNGVKYSYYIRAYNGSYLSGYAAKAITCKK